MNENRSWVTLAWLVAVSVVSSAGGLAPDDPSSEPRLEILERVARGLGGQVRFDDRALCFSARPPLPAPPEGIALVEYGLGKTQFCIAARLGNTRRTVAMPIREPDARHVIARWLARLRVGEEEHGLLITRLLMLPVADILAEARIVVFVPGGILHEVPFSAVKLPSGRYVIEEMPVAVLPIRDLLTIESNAKVGLGFRPRLIIGDPAQRQGSSLPMAKLESSLIDWVYEQSKSGHNQTSRGPTAVRDGGGFSPSISSGTGTPSGIAKLGGGDVTLGGDFATVDNLRKQIGGKRLLHIATHRTCRSGKYPALVIGSPSADPRPTVHTVSRDAEGRLLYSWEASCLDVASLQLVVLSGCETAVFARGDKPPRIESLAYSSQFDAKPATEAPAILQSAPSRPADSRFIRSLAAPFLFRGVPFFLGTLWAVEDSEDTVQLIVDFHQHVASGFGPAQALRCAKQAALATSAKWGISTWSAFSLLTGDIEALETPSGARACLPSVEVTARIFRSKETRGTYSSGDWFYRNIRWPDFWPEAELAILELAVPKREIEYWMELSHGCLSKIECIHELSGFALQAALTGLAPDLLHDLLSRHAESVEPD